MDNIDIEEEDLLFRTRTSLKITKRKVIFAVVCFSCWCILTVGVGYIFYTIGKRDGQIYKVNDSNTVELKNLYKNSTNGTEVQGDMLVFSKEASKNILRMVEIFKNQSKEAFQQLQETKDEFRKLLEDSKNQSCNVLNITIEDEF